MIIHDRPVLECQSTFATLDRPLSSTLDLDRSFFRSNTWPPLFEIFNIWVETVPNYSTDILQNDRPKTFQMSLKTYNERFSSVSGWNFLNFKNFQKAFLVTPFRKPKTLCSFKVCSFKTLCSGPPGTGFVHPCERVRERTDKYISLFFCLFLVINT